MKVLREEKKVCVKVYNEEGELLSVAGERYAENGVVSLELTNDCHYVGVEPQRTVGGGENDCLLQSFISGLPDDKYDGETCDERRDRVATCIQRGNYVFSTMLENGRKLQNYELNQCTVVLNCRD